MKVKCLHNRKRDLPVELQREGVAYGPAYTDMPLTIGREYVVYAMTARAGFPWYFIQDDDELPYPQAYPAPLFEITDTRLSRVWHFNIPGDVSKCEWPNWGPSEWVSDRFFYDRLTDCQPEEVRTFARYKAVMDREFEASA
jgi:hypothetical protein